MMIKILFKFSLIISLSTLMFSCANNDIKSDAYGNFESDKVTISSEANGRILKLQIEEGDLLKKGQEIGLIDTLSLYYKKEQILAQRNSLQANFQHIDAQIEVQQQQLENIKTNKERIERLFIKKAATKQQLDDINGKYQITQKQIIAIQSQKNALQQQINAIDKQIQQIQLSISRCKIICPINGTVLSKLSMQGEMAGTGKPLFTLADLSSLKLKAYISENQLSSVKIGQKMTVKIDSKDGIISLPGILTWVSESAEFTPKTIQTREVRINLVYAIKVKVENDGRLKIGMPAEVVFENTGN